jgi:hypothetical protein
MGRQGVCIECHKDYAKKRRATGALAVSVRKNNLRKYKLTVGEYATMLRLQNGRCAICGRADNKTTHNRKQDNFAVDHCHETGKIRGLLCHSCNISIGRFQDNPALLRAAADYLERFKRS